MNTIARHRRTVASSTLALVCLAAPGLSQSWAPATSFPTANRSDMAGIFHAGQLLAIGGSPLIAPKLNEAPVESLVLGGASWASLTPLDGPTARCGAGVDAIGHVIVFGGVDPLDPSGDKGKAYWYDLVEGKKGGVPQRTSSASSDHFAYATDDAHRVYSIGGGPGASASASKPNSSLVERYDAITNLWTATAPMNAGVSDAVAVNDGAGHLLVIGGYDATGSLLSNVARYDVASGVWSDVAVPDLPTATADHAAALGADGRVYVIGGRTVAGLVADVWVLDASFSAWTPGVSLPTARADGAAVLASDDQIYLLGGRDGLGGTSEVLTLFTPTCPTFPGSTAGTQKVWSGMSAALTHATAGGAPISYRWQKNGVDVFDGLTASGSTLSGTATATLQIADTGLADMGSYALVASNGCGQALAPSIALDVQVPPLLTGVWSFEVLGAAGSLGAAGNGIGDANIVGAATLPDPKYTSLSHPYIWPIAPGSPVDLTPASSVGGSLRCEENGVQAGWYWWPYTVPGVGTGYNMHACVWSGTAGSYIDIQPTSWEFGSVSDTDGTRHVGTLRYDESSTTGHGHYWLSSQKSAIKLTPPGDWGSSATAMFGADQFGAVVHPFATTHAAKWSGSAASFVNMNPAGSSWSYITDAAEGVQVGRATIAGTTHAALWAGSAQSFIDLNPTGAIGGELYATHGGLQVGLASYPGANNYATVWRGAPDDFIDLQSFADATHPHPILRDVRVMPSGEVLVTGYAMNTATSQSDNVLFRMIPRSLVADVTDLSLATGGTQNLVMNAGLGNAGKFFLILGSASGTSPGLPVNGVTLPLNLDGYLTFSLTSAGTGLFQGTLGVLDATGQTSASLVLPPAMAPALAGMTLHHAGIVLDLTAGGQAVLATNAEALHLVP